MYHYHVQDAAPFTVGCFGPNDDGSLVTVAQCRDFYPGCDGDLVDVSQPGGSKQYDLWCPCYDANGSNTGLDIAELAVFSGATGTQAPTSDAGSSAIATDASTTAATSSAANTGAAKQNSNTNQDSSRGETPVPCPPGRRCGDAAVVADAKCTGMGVTWGPGIGPPPAGCEPAGQTEGQGTNLEGQSSGRSSSARASPLAAFASGLLLAASGALLV